MFPESQLVELI